MSPQIILQSLIREAKGFPMTGVRIFVRTGGSKVWLSTGCQYGTNEA